MNRRAWGLSLLFGTFALIQAIGEPTSGLAYQPACSVLKAWGSNARGIGTFLALLGLPWCVKPLYGLLTDFVPLAGYRRKSYLIASALVATVFFACLYLLPISERAYTLLFVGLVLPGVAVAVSDVVVDALVIETGQSLRITGHLQSVCIGASYVASLLTGFWGGILSQEHRQRVAFLCCAVLTAVTGLMAVFWVREPRHIAPLLDRHPPWPTLIEILRSRGLWTVGGFLFCWHLNPFTHSVLYIHTTGPLGYSERDFGECMTYFSMGSIAACVSYAMFCRRFTMKHMLPVSIACGAASTLVYWTLTAGCDLNLYSLAAGFNYMIATMIVMDLTARACPVKAAATVFAFWMALCNVSSGLATWAGGACYDAATSQWGSSMGFTLVLSIAAVCMLGSWLAARVLPSHLLN